MFMTYGSVCSGIEAASVALEPLGLVPVWFSEIEPFPCAVLSHHWPHVPNLGDMTKIAASIASGEIGAPDILVGGTPCQAFSVAGMRQGLSDDRGALTIKFVEIADEIDKQRGAGNECVVWWENVPGVLSSKDNAFGCFLGALAGEECELQPPGRKWENAGYVRGPKRTIAWRILDAQYFGVAQRRRRVFVVASARTDFDPSKVLFEREGVRRDTPPSRETGSVVAALTANGVGTCGADDNQGQAGHLIATDVCPTLRAGGNASGGDRPPGTDVDTAESLIVVHGTQDPDTNTELAHTLGRNHGQENAVAIPAIALQTDVTPKASEELAFTLKLPSSSGGGQSAAAMTPDLAVRRLTPVECERLQGFPDGHTDVTYRGKPAADGPRYKAIGNSMAVPCMRWIGERLIAR
ncbi:MAG: DNA cytosine methyltransferase [Aeromonadaceae bacterium]